MKKRIVAIKAGIQRPKHTSQIALSRPAGAQSIQITATYHLNQLVHLEFLVECRFGSQEGLVLRESAAAGLGEQFDSLKRELLLPQLRVLGVLLAIGGLELYVLVDELD